MRIVSLTVENFRSITSAKRIPFADYTLLVGPNNEGKSNILKALSVALKTLERWRAREIRMPDGRIVVRPPDQRYRYYEAGQRETVYRWDIDCPINLKGSKKAKESNITIEFNLDEEEVGQFKEFVGSNLNGTLPIKITFRRDDFTISIAKPGRGHATLNKKSARIATFVSERIKCEYVPAVRTAGSAAEVVRTLVSSELSLLEKDERMAEALKTIDEIQRPVLDRLSESITETVSSFLPSVKAVRLKSSSSGRANVLRRTVQIEVNDGVQTDLAQKGDGVQSLVALALMRHASEDAKARHYSIVAIEEPESHLHPKAIRDLRDVIVNLSNRSQVVVSSHSPLLVRWEGNTSTVIVGGSRASQATRIAEVRDSLGVMVADNLSSVEFSLLVEGMSDRRILEHILRNMGSGNVRPFIESGRMAVQEIRGAGKLSYAISMAERNIVRFHVFLDNDQGARNELKKAIDKKYIKEYEYTLCTCAGMPESEIEDIIRTEIYHKIFLEKFGVDLHQAAFKSSAKWSDRMKKGFQASGKLWSDRLLEQLKETVADKFVSMHPDGALIPQKRSAIDSLLKALSMALHD